MKRLFFFLFSVWFIHISIFAVWQGPGYYRVQADKSKRYISVIGSKFTESTNPDAFQNCIKMDTLENIFTNPGTIIYINSLTNSPSLQAQGENTSDLISYNFKFKTNPDGTIEAYYSIFFGAITMYLQDYNTGIDVGKTEDYASFNLFPLDNVDNYFAVAPDVEYNGYYYTTLRVAFNFILPENVYAYIIRSGKLQLFASPGQIVPKNFQVILKCKSSEKEQNKLLPTTATALSATTNDLKKATKYHKYTIHKGQFINGSGGSGNNVIVQVNQGDAKSSTNSTYRVLGVKDGCLGFYENFWDEQTEIHGTADAVKCLDGNRAYWVVSTEDANGGMTLLEKPTIQPSTGEFTAGESVNVTVSSEATKMGATIQYKIDDGEWQTYQNGVSITSDEDEDVTHTISVRTVNAGIESVISSETYTFLAPLEVVDLAGIVSNGTVGKYYDVWENTKDATHYLYGAKVVGNTLYAKDYGRFINPEEKPEGAIDGMSRFYDYSEHYDQSNWVALSNIDNPQDYEGKELIVVGKLLNRTNPEIKVRSIVEKRPEQTGWSVNTANAYCPASFIGTQTGTNGKTYFFVKPKPQEVVRIVGAIYGGEDKFYITAPDGYYNTVELKGGFVIDRSLMPSSIDFVKNQAYNFNAVVKKVEPKSATFGYFPYIDGGVSAEYVVYPFGETQDDYVPTGIQSVECNAKVVGVKYYNAMGVESDVPFKGVNIVVTTYDNGTRTTSKILK